jgi:hypothetical protein
LRACGILIEERCRGSEQEEVAFARPRAHRLLGLRQKLGMAMRISEGSLEDLVPSAGHILLIAERENRLRRGNMRHAKPCRFACKRTNESMTQAHRAYRGTRGIQARHGGVATPDCGEPAPDMAHPPRVLPRSVDRGGTRAARLPVSGGGATAAPYGANDLAIRNQRQRAFHGDGA